jgi:Flp pilus assembly protein TadG
MSAAARHARSPLARRPRGQALVEFALVAPIFFVLLIGLIEGGRYVFYTEILNHATREGARYQVVHGANSSAPTGPTSGDPGGQAVKDAVVAAATALADSEADFDAIVLDWSPENNERGTTITVTVEYTYAPVVPLFGPISVSAESSLVINN